MVARFGEPEHKAAGDRRCPTSLATLEAGAVIDNPFLDFQLTFGDWVALGDWFEDIGRDQGDAAAAPGRRGQDRPGLLRRVREDPAEERARGQDAQNMGGKADLDERDKKAVLIATAAQVPQHQALPEPAVGRRTSPRPGRPSARQGRRPFGAIAQYHPDHLEAIELARGRHAQRRAFSRRGARDGRLRLPLPHRLVLREPPAHAAREHQGVLGPQGAQVPREPRQLPRRRGDLRDRDLSHRRSARMDRQARRPVDPAGQVRGPTSARGEIRKVPRRSRSAISSA